MATLTGSYAAAGVPPRFNEKGVFACVFSYDNGIGAAAASTLSNGDTILMGKIGHGVTILDGYLLQTMGDTGSVSVGLEGSVTNLVASGSTSASEKIVFSVTGFQLPFTVSVSDDTVVRFQTVKIGVDSDFTTTTQFKVVLLCAGDV